MSCKRHKGASLGVLQGGTGKHVDASMEDPFEERPFQALVQLSQGQPGGSDGSLRAVPGFHAVGGAYFQACRPAARPRGGFFPLQDDDHGDLIRDDRWLPVADYLKRGWAPLPEHAPPERMRSRASIMSHLDTLRAELEAFGPGDPPSPGSYVVWDPR